MKAKDKVKKFVTEHKTQIKRAAITLGVGVLGGVLGYAACTHKTNQRVHILHDDIGHVFNDALAKGLCPGTVLTDIVDTPLKANDLGVLGERLKSESNYDERMEFTHFIGIGKPINK